jgi:hypothetical protein
MLAVFRVALEHMAHGGTENGNLVVTYDDFERAGIRRMSIKQALAEVTGTGLVLITERGRPSVGVDRWPTRYALGWLPLHDGSAPSNRWKAWRARFSSYKL